MMTKKEQFDAIEVLLMAVLTQATADTKDVNLVAAAAIRAATGYAASVNVPFESLLEAVKTSFDSANKAIGVLGGDN